MHDYLVSELNKARRQDMVVRAEQWRRAHPAGRPRRGPIRWSALFPRRRPETVPVAPRVEVRPA